MYSHVIYCCTLLTATIGALVVVSQKSSKSLLMSSFLMLTGNVINNKAQLIMVSLGISSFCFGCSPTQYRLRLALDYFSGFLEYPMGSDVHKFVEVNGSFNFADPSMECVDISQVADKFPDLYGAYRQGPAEAFFLVKHWVDMTYDPQRAGRILSENDTMHGMVGFERHIDNILHLLDG